MLGGVPIVTTGRGGKITFHGPGQRVVYMTIALERRYGMIDLHRFLRDLEQWVIGCLGHWGIRSFTMPGMTGVWLEDARGQHRKICAIGIRARRGIVTHGIALNVHPDLRYFDRIVPCGIQGYGVTSLHAEGYELSMEEVDRVLQMPSLMFQ
jgi:lipoyl(octanoyl) transferase